MKDLKRYKIFKNSKNFFLSGSLILVGLILSQPVKAQVDTLNKYILTPKAGPEPHINGAKVLGLRPGHPLLFTIPVSGERPITFSAKGLPDGVKLDAVNGRLSGEIDKKGDYKISLKAKNSKGESNSSLLIKVGEDI